MSLEGSQISKQLRARYLLALFLVFALSSLALLTLVKLISVNKKNSYLINIAGRQRMLSQRIAKNSISHFLKSDESSKTKILNDIDLFSQAHKELIQVEIKNLKDLYYGSKNLDLQVRNYSYLAKSILNDKNKTKFSLLLNQADNELISLLDEAVSILEKYSDQQLQKIKLFEISVFIITILVLILEFRFIFAPIEKLIEKAFQSLDKSIKSQENKNKELKMLSFSFTHDIKEPIRRIAINSDLLKTDLANEKKESTLAKIKKNTSKLQSLVNDIQNYLSWDSYKEEKTICNPQEIILDITESLKRETGLELELKFVNLVDKLNLERRPFKEVLRQIIKNAYVFAKDSKVEIEIDIQETNDSYQINIRDNGVGMDQATLIKAFDIFAKGDNDDLESRNGIGLAIVKKIAQNFNWQLDLSSELHIGTRLKLDIPR